MSGWLQGEGLHGKEGAVQEQGNSSRLDWLQTLLRPMTCTDLDRRLVYGEKRERTALILPHRPVAEQRTAFRASLSKPPSPDHIIATKDTKNTKTPPNDLNRSTAAPHVVLHTPWLCVKHAGVLEKWLAWPSDQPQARAGASR